MAFRLDFYRYITTSLGTTLDRATRVNAIRPEHCEKDSAMSTGRYPMSYQALVDALDPAANYTVKIVSHASASISSFEECFRRLFLQPRKYMNRTGTLPYQVMFKQTYQMIKQTMGKAYAVEFSELFAEYLRALHWILPYPRDNRFMRTDHKEIWVWSNYLPMGSIFSRKSISLAHLLRQPTSSWHRGHTDRQCPFSLLCL